MKEDFIYFVWKFKLFDKNLTTNDGKAIEVISPGVRNNDSGPDFFNAKIKIGDVVWSGNVEIHIKSSDWKLHGHDKNDAYSNVILHVVLDNNAVTVNSKGNNVETVILQYPWFIEEKYREIQNSNTTIPCQYYLKNIDGFKIKSFLRRMAAERFEEKVKEISQISINSINDWEHVFKHMLFKAFGFKVNSLPFEMLYRSLPRINNSKSVFEMEALLLGQAGFLEGELTNDAYFERLVKEYKHLVVKHQLKCLDKSIWKFARIRPANFPTIRIAQLAALISKYPDMFDLITGKKVKDYMMLFDVAASGYWDSHFVLGSDSEMCYSKNLGASSIESILINAVAPILFAYGDFKDDDVLRETAMDLLENIKAESHKIVFEWAEAGIKANNALETQGMINLKNSYCKNKKCLSCTIGKEVIKS